MSTKSIIFSEPVANSVITINSRQRRRMQRRSKRVAFNTREAKMYEQHLYRFMFGDDLYVTKNYDSVDAAMNVAKEYDIPCNLIDPYTVIVRFEETYVSLILVTSIFEDYGDISQIHWEKHRDNKGCDVTIVFTNRTSCLACLSKARGSKCLKIGRFHSMDVRPLYIKSPMDVAKPWSPSRYVHANS